jgi:hypothetical protein
MWNKTALGKSPQEVIEHSGFFFVPSQYVNSMTCSIGFLSYSAGHSQSALSAGVLEHVEVDTSLVGHGRNLDLRQSALG